MRFCLISAVILVMSLMQGASAKSDEDRLVTKLLEDFLPVGRIARPVSSAKDNVTVTLELSLQRIVSLEKNVLKFDMWVDMKWKDPRLTWRPADYNKLSSVALPADLLWLPDIRPYYTIQYEPSRELSSRVSLSYDGQVTYVLPVRATSWCNVAENNSTTCYLKLISWRYFQAQLDLRLPQSDSFESISYESNEDWDLKDTSAKLQHEFYDCCPEPWVIVTCSMQFEPRDRKSSDSRRSKKSVSKRSNRHVI